MTEIKCTINGMHLNHPETFTHPWAVGEKKKKLSSMQNWSLMSKRLGIAPLNYLIIVTFKTE